MRKIFLLLTTTLTGFIFSCNNNGPDSGQASAALPAINNQGVHIDYTDSGKGDTVLLFVHGWCINKTYWTDQVNFFSPKYRVVTVDLPGFGQSGKNRSTWDTYTYGKDIDSVMAGLDLHNVILIGHSMAGPIIIEAARIAPDRVLGLVGIDNFKNFGHTYTAKDSAEWDKDMNVLKQHFRQTVKGYFNEALFYKTTDSAVKARVLNDVDHADSAIAIACQVQGFYDDVAALRAAKKPLHLINSDVTPTDTAGFKAKNLPFGIKYIHETGHFPMVEKPQAFDSLLDQTVEAIKREAK